MRLSFETQATDGHARAGRVTLVRGSFETPVFMPVGTLATVKAIIAEHYPGRQVVGILAHMMAELGGNCKITVPRSSALSISQCQLGAKM